MIIKASTRRAQRRLRAKARLSWFLHKTGKVRLNLSRLISIRNRLSTHHSKDEVLISRISSAIMANYEPWRCKYCKKISKASAHGCSQCLTHWQDVSGYRICSSSKARRLELSSRIGQEPATWTWKEGEVPTSEVPTTGEERTWERWISRWISRWSSDRQRGWKVFFWATNWQRQAVQPEGRQRQGKRQVPSRGNHGSSRATMDTDLASDLPSFATTVNTASTNSRGDNIERADQCIEKVFAGDGSGSASHCAKIPHEGWPKVHTISLYSSRRFEHCEGDFGHRQIGAAPSSHQMAQLPHRCSSALAEAHRRFSTRRASIDSTDRNSKSGIGGSCQTIRRLQVGIGSSSDRCRGTSSHGGSIHRCSRRRHCGCSSVRQPCDYENTAGNGTGISGSHGHRRSHQLQQKASLDEGFAASAPSSGGGVPSAVAPAMQPFAQREKQEHLGVAFCEARQVVTEVYSCQGLQQHPCILNWTHSACDESWFVTRWYAIESAYELAWQLGTPPTVLPQSSVWKSPVCGKRRNVRFSSDVELRFVQEEPIMTATLTILESQLQNWAEKPWSRHPVKTPSFSSCIERSVERVTPTKNVGFQFQERKPLQAIEDLPNLPSIALVQEPQSFKAVLIRTSCNIEKQASGEAQPFQFH